MTAPQDPFSTPAEGTGSPGPGAPPPYGTHPHGGAAYGAPPWGSAPFGTAPRRPPRNGLGVAALVLGILGVLTSVLVVGGLLGLAAVVLGVLGRGRAKRGEATNGGMSLAGLLLGGLAVLVSIALVAGVATFLNTDSGQRLRDCLASAGTDPAAQQRCQAEFQREVSGY